MTTPLKIAKKYPLLVQIAGAALGAVGGPVGTGLSFGIFAVQAGKRLWNWMKARTPQERVILLQDATQASTGDMKAAIAEAKEQLAEELKDVSPEVVAEVSNWLLGTTGHLNRTFAGTFDAMKTHGGSQLAVLNNSNQLHALFPGGMPVMQPGQHIEKSQYNCVSLLGSGGFGEVWLADHTELTMNAAFKFCTDEKAVRSLQNEKHKLNLLQTKVGKHPNIVPLLGCCLETDLPWLHFEYVKGLTLAQWVAGHGGPVPEAAVIGVLRQLCAGLSAAHKVAVVHSDMKPANVIMDDRNDGRVRITDFGIGRVSLEMTREYTRTVADQDWLSSAGTLNYMSREQREGHPAAPADDVYAVGVMAYQMLVGDLHTDTSGNVNGHLERIGVTADLRAIVGRCLENREHRYKDADELLADLPTLGLPQKLKRVALVVGLIGLLVGAGLFFGPGLTKDISSDGANQETQREAVADSACPHAKAFNGEWYFTTRAMGAHDRKHVGMGEYYVLEMEEADCSVQTTLKRVGRNSRIYKPSEVKHGTFTFSPEAKDGYDGGASATVKLESQSDGKSVVEFHLVVDGDALFGWWAYYEESWRQAGFWGALRGKRGMGHGRDKDAWGATRMKRALPDQPCTVYCQMGCEMPRRTREHEVLPVYQACLAECAKSPRVKPDKCKETESVHKFHGLAKADRKHVNYYKGRDADLKPASWWIERCSEHLEAGKISYAYAACNQVQIREVANSYDPGKLYFNLYRLAKHQQDRELQIRSVKMWLQAAPGNQKAKEAWEALHRGSHTAGVEAAAEATGTPREDSETTKTADAPVISVGEEAAVGLESEYSQKGLLPKTARHDCSHAKAFDGTWHFTTEVVGGFQRGNIGSAGYYELTLTESGCRVKANLRKVGYSNKLLTTSNAQTGIFRLNTLAEAGFDGAGSGHVQLVKANESTPLNAQYNFIVKGDDLYGWWTYEGLSWKKYGYWGSLQGRRGSGYGDNLAGWRSTRRKGWSNQPCVVQCEMSCETPLRRKEHENTELCRRECAAMPDVPPSSCRGVLHPEGLAEEDRSFFDDSGGMGWSARCHEHYKAGRISYAYAACKKGLSVATNPNAKGALHYNEALLAIHRGIGARYIRKQLEKSLVARPENAEVRQLLRNYGGGR